ncbi:hypothetical protein DTO271G3_3943 [Paecilomyces variotii]|nr:hypothetical protein DTO271G3_3943 [Paecilomyces variotii]
MTTKNLNRTKIDIILGEYRADRAANAPHPIRYLLYDNKFREDIFYEIPHEVEPEALKRALNQYIRERSDKIEYQHEVFKAWPRNSPSHRPSSGNDLDGSKHE